MGANDQIGVGIIGCGDGGTSNARALQGIKEAQIVGFCDVNGGRLAVALEEFGGNGYLELAAMLDNPNVELVVVATPDDQHLAPVKAALEAGKHVFLEKPVATTRSDLAAIRDLVRQYPGKLWFGEKYSRAYPIEAAIVRRDALGPFMWGSTLYAMWRCGRIMGDGKWRTETAYNPCAGGLSHNFMTALLFTGAPIRSIRATGQVLTYHKYLDYYEGYDTMEGTLEFENGRRLSWVICLSVQGDGSPLAHRTISHTFQFEHGALAYGPTPDGDRLIVGGKSISFLPEPPLEEWPAYNIGTLYRGMHADIFAAIRGEREPRHTIEQGINVAAACALAFKSAHQDGRWWLEVP